MALYGFEVSFKVTTIRYVLALYQNEKSAEQSGRPNIYQLLLLCSLRAGYPSLSVVNLLFLQDIVTNRYPLKAKSV